MGRLPVFYWLMIGLIPMATSRQACASVGFRQVTRNGVTSSYDEWIYVGSDWLDVHELMGQRIDKSYASFLMVGMADMGCWDMMAKKGHLWQARETLKALSREFHLKLVLTEWPPSAKENRDRRTYWDDGNRVAKFQY